MSNHLVRQVIVAEFERAKELWDAVPGNEALVIDYENTGEIDLSAQLKAYLSVDIVFRDGEQMDMNPDPNICDDGQIMIAAGIKLGSGTQEAEKLRDYIRPFFQRRDDLAQGVRTHVAQPHAPRTARGFYYLPLVVGFWRVVQAPAVP